MTYPYVPAKFDYGVRKGPALGLMFHMAEGGGTVHYLSKAGGVQRGVSVHAVCELSGRVVQMLPWAHASGSLNPTDTSTNKAYYGHDHLVDVLGWPRWEDPNSYVLSMEIEGFAKIGPNPAQVDGAVAWGEDMKSLFSSLRGALGHADQTNTKFCPGTTLAMKLIFEGVGGHGLWHPQSGPSQPPGDPMPTIVSRIPVIVDLHPGDELLDVTGKHLIDVSVGQQTASPWAETLPSGGTYRLIGVVTGGKDTPCLIHATPTNTHPIPPVDCSGPVAAEHERTRQQDIKALEALP